MTLRTTGGRVVRDMLFVLMLVVGPVSTVAAQVSLMEGRKQWTGQIKKQGAESKNYLASEKDLGDLWTHWEIRSPPPSIDFRKDFAVVYTGHGGLVLMELTLEKDGNLVAKFVQAPTMSYWPQYLIVAVKRAAVRSINGKPLKLD